MAHEQLEQRELGARELEATLATMHLVCDRVGNPLGMVLSAGQLQEVTHLKAVLASVPAGVGPPNALVGDKGFSANWVREYLGERGIQDVVARRKDELERLSEPPAFDKDKYRDRNVIERLNGWLKEHRRIGTRYEKLAVNFRAMIQIACIRWYLVGMRFSDTP